MSFTPTPEQRDAITARGGALLISAGAGSGKTRVLVERLLSRVTDPDDPCEMDEFLIITFTVAAARELRSRILDTVNALLSEHPGDRRLARQAALCRRTEIGTIHGFCSNLLRENAQAAGLPPDFRIADENEAVILKNLVIERVLEERYETMPPGFDALVNMLAPGRNDRRLPSITLELFDKLMSHHDPEAWIAEQKRASNPDPTLDAAQTPWGALLLADARNVAAYWVDACDAMLGDLAGSPDALRAYGGAVSSGLNQAAVFAEAAKIGWDAAREAASFEFPRLGPLRGNDFEHVKTAWGKCRKELRAVAETLSVPSAELLGDMAAVHPVLCALFDLTLAFRDVYSAEKRRRKLVDFADLEHLTAALVSDSKSGAPTSLGHEISLRYKEIMIDEYQDVSAIQDRILAAVSRGGHNLTMVGDVRQSIYRFRLAEPTIFLEKYR
ncbi:MAG: UvrD-helicase domain-containing protein, partial [Oscillospiraceae bacterium]|nr:UvrD-helicase domain-containing protein [Oscillospiraceae bacterium]